MVVGCCCTYCSGLLGDLTVVLVSRIGKGSLGRRSNSGISLVCQGQGVAGLCFIIITSSIDNIN